MHGFFDRLQPSSRFAPEFLKIHWSWRAAGLTFVPELAQAFDILLL
jgi:hypothetical protein